MGLIVEQWDKQKAEQELTKRLRTTKEARKSTEMRWETNRRMIFSPQASLTSQFTVSYDSLAQLVNTDLDGSDSDFSINYLFKYVRFIHSQMSANPPSVTPVPTSTDLNDRRAAEVADYFVQHGRRQHKLSEQVDLTTLQTLAYGTGITKTAWNPLAGDIRDFDKETQEITMQGDVEIRPMILQNVWIDPDARCNDEIKWTFERHVMSTEEARFRFPEHKAKIDEMKGAVTHEFWDKPNNNAEHKADLFEYYEYTEKGLPWNGMAGRQCFMLEEGYLLTELTPNPHPNACLPYQILTDIDIPGEVYGRTFIDYLVRLQDVLNRLDSTVLDNISAHGVARLVVFDGAEIEDEALTNGTWDIVTINGAAGQAPMYVNPPTLMPDLSRFRAQLIEGMESLAGVNESMFGQVKREMSGFSLQTAINAGNMVRRRLFEKYTTYVEQLYRTYLELIRTKYTDKRKILVAGEEHAFNTAYFSGSDIADGYDLKVDYGTTLSLDPSSRREEIMQLMPVIEKAMANPELKHIVGLLKLNELDVIYDDTKIAERRQLEIFDEMMVKSDKGLTDSYVPPEKNEDHENMIPAAKRFRMSVTYKQLPQRAQELIDRHLNEREAMVVDQAVPTAPAAPAGPAAPPGAPAGLPGMPPGLV